MSDWQEFQTRVHAVPDEVFPRIFPAIGKAADAGDRGAQELLQLAAAELAWLVNDLVDRLGLGEQEFLLVQTGGMVQRSDYFDEQLQDRLQEAAPHAEFGALAMTRGGSSGAHCAATSDERNGKTERGED